MGIKWFYYLGQSSHTIPPKLFRRVSPKQGNFYLGVILQNQYSVFNISPILLAIRENLARWQMGPIYISNSLILGTFRLRDLIGKNWKFKTNFLCYHIMGLYWEGME